MADLVNTPQFKFPMTISSGGRVGVVEQDGLEDRMQNAVVCMRYERGQRTQLPEFGLPDQALRQGGANLSEIVSSVIRWEPDIDPQIIDSIVNSLDGEQTVTMDLLTPSARREGELSNG